jgi:hypothetical protein
VLQAAHEEGSIELDRARGEAGPVVVEGRLDPRRFQRRQVPAVQAELQALERTGPEARRNAERAALEESVGAATSGKTDPAAVPSESRASSRTSPEPSVVVISKRQRPSVPSTSILALP